MQFQLIDSGTGTSLSQVYTRLIILESIITISTFLSHLSLLTGQASYRKKGFFKAMNEILGVVIYVEQYLNVA